MVYRRGRQRGVSYKELFNAVLYLLLRITEGSIGLSNLIPKVLGRTEVYAFSVP